MRRKYTLPLLLLLHIVPLSVFAQEVLMPMDNNPVIKNYLKTNGIQAAYRLQTPGDTLALPFVDDFSESGIYPSSERWVDNKVFINSDVPRVMPTVGAATFDGLDEFGNPYVPGTISSGSADALTSQPLYLYTNTQGGVYSIADSIYISFYFEKKGYGDAPEASDSLVLEFYRPSVQTWTREWFSLGGVASGQDTVFNQVNVLLTNAAYLEDGFQFRFRSYGNLSGSLDNWHVDYIRFFSSSGTSSALVDQAFVNDRNTILETFTSMPWKHYKTSANQQLLIKDSSTINYIIYQNQPLVNAGFKHRAIAYDLDTIGLFGVGSSLFPVSSNQRLNYSYPINYTFPNAKQLTDDSTYFDLVDYFSTQQGGDNIYSNDTIRYRQYFYNYYSYDDGTCELGYDLINAANGKIAMRFDMLQADTLRGVQMFFTQQNAVVASKLITLKVWSSLSPETVLYQLTNQFPSYVDSINGFATYVFNTPVPASGFYIGFQQVSPDGLHLGFDRNTTSNTKMFYNTSGIWSQVSVLPGSFMIRPLVGSMPLVGVDESKGNEKVIRCHPNPTTGTVYISVSDVENRYNRIKLYNITGDVVFDNYFTQGNYDFSQLAAGVYTIQLSGKDIYSIHQKLIINN
jgi:Secretion system C-terminal sorting domain